MNRLRVSIVGTVLFLVVEVTCMLMTSHKTAAQKPPDPGPSVNIASPLPLPVTGTLSFAAGSAVSVNNPASSPVLVRDVDRGIPFQKFAVAFDNRVSFGTVPAGERWIIEHVSGSAGGNSGFVNYFELQALFGNQVVESLIAQNAGSNEFLTNSQTRVIVDPGQKVDFAVFGSLTVIETRALISGIIVPAP